MYSQSLYISIINLLIYILQNKMCHFIYSDFRDDTDKYFTIEIDVLYNKYFYNEIISHYN